MDRLIATSSRKHSLLSTHKVLAQYLFFVVDDAGIFCVYRHCKYVATFAGTSFDSDAGLFLQTPVSDVPAGQQHGGYPPLATFALTGFMGYILGLLLSMLLASGA